MEGMENEATELPTISSSNYTSTVVIPTVTNIGTGGIVFDPRGHASQSQNWQFAQDFQPEQRTVAAGDAAAAEEQELARDQRRVVQVFIADPDDRVPLKDALLYEGTPHLTDLTDQELFFDVPIKELLSKHNSTRETILDEKASERFGRNVKLKPVKIRELKMTVVTIAEF